MVVSRAEGGAGGVAAAPAADAETRGLAEAPADSCCPFGLPVLLLAHGASGLSLCCSASTVSSSWLQGGKGRGGSGEVRPPSYVNETVKFCLDRRKHKTVKIFFVSPGIRRIHPRAVPFLPSHAKVKARKAQGFRKGSWRLEIQQYSCKCFARGAYSLLHSAVRPSHRLRSFIFHSRTYDEGQKRSAHQVSTVVQQSQRHGNCSCVYCRKATNARGRLGQEPCQQSAAANGRPDRAFSREEKEEPVEKETGQGWRWWRKCGGC